MTYTVVILPLAENDFAVLYDYIANANRSPQGAANWVNVFDDCPGTEDDWLGFAFTRGLPQISAYKVRAKPDDSVD